MGAVYSDGSTDSMLLGYAHVSKANDSQRLDLQHDAWSALVLPRSASTKTAPRDELPSEPGDLPERTAAGQYLHRLEARSPGACSETSGDHRG